jgi:hypothetical protein
MPLKHDPKVRLIGDRADKEVVSQYSKIGWREQTYVPEYVLMAVLTQNIDDLNYHYFKSNISSSPAPGPSTAKAKSKAKRTGKKQ